MTTTVPVGLTAASELTVSRRVASVTWIVVPTALG